MDLRIVTFIIFIIAGSSILCNVGANLEESLLVPSYRLCIPSGSQNSCDQMIKDKGQNDGKIKCVTASGKIGCIESVLKNEADFLSLEPEEIYVAQKYKRNGFSIIGEIRSEEFKTRDYRYEPVAVIRRSSGINGISDLKGKKSCHTGFGRVAGWKVPFSHLMDKNELTGFCKEIDAPTPQRDLYAFSKYFSKACAPGPWVPEKDYDATLRNQYPNLCQLCKNPRECNGNDAYAGYSGALKCLTENQGDVAWTKMDAVQTFFKLNTTAPTELAKDYAFLCWDGSSQPLTSPSATFCSWAKRPWRAYLVSERLSREAIADLQKEISAYADKAKELRQANSNLNWDINVLEINSTVDVFSTYEPRLAKSSPPLTYLQHKNYSVTIEKPSCSVTKHVQICVKNVIEKLKCMELQLAAIGRRIVPGFRCILGESTDDCFRKVQNGEADAVISSAKEAAVAKMNYGLTPILDTLEVINATSQEKAPYKYAVAVIRADSSIKNLTDLKGKRSCHGSIHSLSGWNIPLRHLRNAGMISGPTCGLPIQMSHFFNESCVPGLFDAQKNMPWLPDSLCALCSGDSTLGEPNLRSPGTFCQAGPSERYYGQGGALRCLADHVADVAFIDHVGLLHSSKGIIDLTELRLLCPEGQVMETSNFRKCNWGKIPSMKILSRDGDPNKIGREDTKLSLLKASDAFSPTGSSNVMPLFGPYYTNVDVLFRDTSVGLTLDIQDVNSDDLINAFDFCQTSAGMTLMGSLPTLMGGILLVLLIHLN